MKSESQDFLAEVLETKDFQIQALAGDASSRRYYRVVVDETSQVLMEWDPFTNIEDYPFLNVQRYFRNIGIHVPKVLATSPELGLVLQEDLGDLTLERRYQETQDKSISLPYYRQAIDELVKIQIDATNQGGPCVALNTEFDTAKFMWEMNYAKKHVFLEYAKIKLSEKVERELENLFIKICEHLDQQPKRLCHRDYHSRNLMIKFNKVRVIDFQDARLGPIQYDLVSLIRDSYVSIDDEFANTLLSYYADKCANSGFQVKLNDEFYNTYEIQTIQRAFKACGSFTSFFNQREDRRYLKYLPKTSATVISSLASFPEYKLLSDLLTECELTE